MSAVFQPPGWLAFEDLLRRMDVPVPRHASYPTASLTPSAPRTAARRCASGSAVVTMMFYKCQACVDFEARGAAHLPDGHEAPPLGWFFVRGPAMVFDPHLRAAEHSRVLRII